MKTVLIKSIVIFAACLLVPAVQASSHFLVCGVDMSDKDTPYRWEIIEADLPIYIYPDDTVGIYRSLLNRYLDNLKPDDAQRSEVSAFVQLLEKLVANEVNPLLKVGPNPMTDEVELLNSDQRVLLIKCDDITRQYLIDIVHLQLALRKIHDESFSQLRSQADANIQRRNQQYQNWFDNGLPMWPQETWLNGIFLDESDAVEPAHHQWVFLRPSVGLGVNSDDGINDGNLEATLGVEVGGFVHYLKDDYSSYWGVSVLATLGEDAGVGWGGLLRYDNYVLGFTRRNRDLSAGISEDRDYLYIGYDLLQLIDEKKNRFRGFKQKVRAGFAEYQQ